MAGADNNFENTGVSPVSSYQENDERTPITRNEKATAQHTELALNNCERMSYGVGHVLNDLTASMWFSYLLVFLHQVRNFPNLLAGNLMLIGQVSDAIFTPFIGFESDRTQGIKYLGKRKTWHLIGTLCVMASFPFLFIECITCGFAPNIAQFVYYAPFVVIFQFGWAATQISHLSFANDYTPYSGERVRLQSIRNSFTVMSNLSVYGIFVLLFYLEGKSSSGSNDDLGPGDGPKFRNLALISVGLGTVFNVIFYVGTKERRKSSSDQKSLLDPEQTTIERSTVQKSKMQWKDWLKEHQFYQIALLYMTARLYINVSQVYFPMYLTETVKLDKNSIAILPLVTYVSSFFMSLLAPVMNHYAGRKLSYFIGALIGIASCLWLYFVGHRDFTVYGCAVLMGCANSLLLITVISLTSDLIKQDTESGAFVFGAMSFTDKLSNGLAVLLIQKFHPCEGCCPACEPYYRYVQSTIPGGALIVALIALATLGPQIIGERRLRTNTESKESLVDADSDACPQIEVMVSPSQYDPSLRENGFTDSVQCSCGVFYTPPSSCSTCGKPPQYGANGTIRHHADIHHGYDTDDTDDSNEIEPLVRNGNINTPEKSILADHLYTEDNSHHHPCA
ncbi:major facilitator superfamily domain-containing protein 12 isoform X2 [Aplysia californica]|uniref:Major facilitator superfamily domain-containing protein 12 isoform X2 n=1 Tax=Aplysia californica TaxID=6500 RepID=A0ABM0ZZT0_APLCA|nr:major facilitator superfamily domain-containing protein 12 isoform X2 [Aplysia californica]